MPAGTSGSRKDNNEYPQMLSVMVQVVAPPPIQWSATDPEDQTLTKMACAGLISPAANLRVARGANLSCAVATASDYDLRVD